jgi:uncharacterized protein (UPF0335 family)
MPIPSSPADRTAIKKTLQTISDSMTRIEGERDFIREEVKEICEKHQLSKKAFRKLVKVYHKKNYSQEQEEQEEFETMYETITNSTTMGAAS